MKRLFLLLILGGATPCLAVDGNLPLDSNDGTGQGNGIRLTSWFGPRLISNRAQMHYGLDLVGASTPVYAVEQGYVEKIVDNCRVGELRCNSGFGNQVRIVSESGGKAWSYHHLSAVLVKEGDVISVGHKLGFVGSTGFSTGAHLHLQGIAPAGQDREDFSINPLRYILPIGNNIVPPGLSSDGKEIYFDENPSVYYDSESDFVRIIPELFIDDTGWDVLGIDFRLKATREEPFSLALPINVNGIPENIVNGRHYTFRFGPENSLIALEYKGKGMTRSDAVNMYGYDAISNLGHSLVIFRVSIPVSTLDVSAEYPKGRYRFLCARTISHNYELASNERCLELPIQSASRLTAYLHTHNPTTWGSKGVLPIPMPAGKGTGVPFDISIDTTDLKAGSAYVKDPFGTTYPLTAASPSKTFDTDIQAGNYKVFSETLAGKQTDVTYHIDDTDFVVLMDNITSVDYSTATERPQMMTMHAHVTSSAELKMLRVCDHLAECTAQAISGHNAYPVMQFPVDYSHDMVAEIYTEHGLASKRIYDL